MLLKKFGLFYLAHTGTFFFLCAYSLAADAPNYAFLPPLFLPIYLAAAVATSERETGDPLLDILPVTPGEIVKVKFWLALGLVCISWLNIVLFTLLQGLPADIAASAMKLGTLTAAGSLLLFMGFQLGIHFFGRSAFRTVIIGYTVVTSIFGIVFFISLARRGHNHVHDFPLLPFLEATPAMVAGALGVAAVALSAWLLRSGPWRSGHMAAE